MTRLGLDERSAAGIALGVAGLFMFNIVCGPFAVGLGFFAYRQGRSRRAALVSIALGVADLVVLAVLLASKVHDGQFYWNDR